ncbi:MAG: DUF4350 domain-containing protein [Dermatophilaceae bacterium]
MTTATAARGLAPSGDHTSGPKPLKHRRRRWFAPFIAACLLLAVALALTLLTPDGRGNTDELDPANPGPSGAQGLAHVLRDRGVEVTVVRSQGELLDETIDGATTVVITHTIRLSSRTARAALEHAAAASGVVLLDPDPEVTKGMGLPVDSHRADLSDLTAGCQGTQVGQDFRLSQADRAYAPTANGSAATTCFPDKSDGGGAMVSLPAAEPGRPPVILLGDDSLISNGAILDADNAAIALRLFGQTNRLVWYIPSLTDIAAADRTSRSIAPAWFSPGVALAASAVVLLCLWRGRRLGRLVTEPLPVIVRAVETTESRGRMYRKSRDRGRALAVLQLATRRRLAAYLGLSVSSAVSSVAAAAASVSGRNYQDVFDLLNSPAAHDDSSLLKLANTLAALEKEVRRT